MEPVPITLARSVTKVRAGPERTDLDLEMVTGLRLSSSLGVLTGEDPATQGIVVDLPNLPPLPALPVGRSPASLVVRSPAPAVLRLTLVPGRPWRPLDDGLSAGILAGDPGTGPLEVAEQERAVVLGTEALQCRIGRRPFGLTLMDPTGRTLVTTAGERRQVAGLPLAPAVTLHPGGKLSVALEIQPGEAITGLGEHFGPLVRNGQRLELVVADALGTGTGRAYKAAPVLHSSAGYSAFVHSPGPVVADVGATWPAVLALEVEGEVMDLFLIVGPDPRERLSLYTELTGRPPMPPRWALGVWMSRCRYRDRAQVEEVVSGLRRHRLPCDVVHLDPSWLVRDRLCCDFEWSEERFGRPEDLVGDLAREGLRLSLWECPYLDPASPAYGEAAAKGFLVEKAGGQPAAVSTFTADGRPRAMVDMSNPEARRWWQERHRPLLGAGVAAFTTDFGEGLPDDAVMSDGSPGRSWCNIYPLWYNRTVAEVAPFVLGRSGWAGSQRYPGQWGGDAECSVAGMAASLRGGLGWAVSAPGLWAHDIGGFSGHGLTPGLFVRWAQWGCLSPLARFHGIGPREPWAFGDRALGIVRAFMELRYRLLPYLLHVAGEAARHGWPLMRPVALEYPGDRAAWAVEHQYLLGSDLLVVPVLDDGPGPVGVACYLPPGEWVDWWSGQARTGPAWVEVEAPLERLPLFARGGSVVPMGPPMQCTDQVAPGEPWTLHVFPGPGRPGEILDGPHVWRPRPVLDATGAVVAVDMAGGRARQAVVHLPGGLVEVPVRG